MNSFHATHWLLLVAFAGSSGCEPGAPAPVTRKAIPAAGLEVAAVELEAHHSVKFYGTPSGVLVVETMTRGQRFVSTTTDPFDFVNSDSIAGCKWGPVNSTCRINWVRTI